jgi:hypothetical protein
MTMLVIISYLGCENSFNKSVSLAMGAVIRGRHCANDNSCPRLGYHLHITNLEDI